MKTKNKKYLNIFALLVSTILVSALFLSQDASAAGLSAGDSEPQKVVYENSEEVFDALAGDLSFSKLALTAANFQNQVQGQNEAAATVAVSYIAQSYQEVVDSAGNHQFAIKKEEKKDNLFVRQSNKQIVNYLSTVDLANTLDAGLQSVYLNTTTTTYYTVVIVVHTKYDQNQLVRDYNNEIVEKKLSLESDEKIFIRLTSVGGASPKITGIESNILQIKGPSNFFADVSYFSNGNSTRDFGIAVCDPYKQSVEEFTKTMSPNTRIRQPINLPKTYLLLGYKSPMLIEENLYPDLIYKNVGADSDLGAAIKRLYNSYYAPDIVAFPSGVSSTPVTSSPSTSSGQGSSSSSKSSSSSDSSSSSKSNSSSGVSTNSSSSNSSSSSSSSSKSSTTGTPFGGTESLSSILNSDPTTDTLFAQKSTLNTLASNLFNEADTEDALGGAMDISKWADDNTNLLKMGNLEGEANGKSLKDTVFSGNWLLGVILALLTIVLIIFSVPLAWKFIKKGSDEDLIQ